MTVLLHGFFRGGVFTNRACMRRATDHEIVLKRPEVGSSGQSRRFKRPTGDCDVCVGQSLTKLYEFVMLSAGCGISSGRGDPRCKATPYKARTIARRRAGIVPTSLPAAVNRRVVGSSPT